MTIARHVRVYGRVQGVFFRAWLREHAEKLQVTGWVRNCPDGRVEAHVEGDDAAVEQIIALIRQGPPAAAVEDVRLWDVELFDFDDFEVRHWQRAPPLGRKVPAVGPNTVQQ